MAAREQQLRERSSTGAEDLRSPFLDEALLDRAAEAQHDELALLEAETVFRHAMRHTRPAAVVDQPEEELGYEQSHPDEEWADEEFYDESAPRADEESAALEGEVVFEGEEGAGGPAAIAEFAANLARERARFSKRPASAEQSALLQDYRDTLEGARARWGKKYGKAPFTVEAIGRAWMISREEETGFKYKSSANVKRLQDFAPPKERAALIRHALVGSSDKAPVAPIVGRFAEELQRRYPGMSAQNYSGHGGGAFNARGHSLDLYIKGRDSRGFYRPDDALSFLRAVDAAAAAVNAEWRIIYNDFSVADAMNRATGRRNVIFVGTVRRGGNKQVNGLNWHGPDPLILHFHLDLAPRAGAAVGRGALPSLPPAPAVPARPASDLVRFAQRVLNAAEGERLTVDGALGPLTQAALERFRKRQNLGGAGVLDAATEIALAQRALEELAQQSMFARPGVRDANTDQALRNFKAERGLETNANLDAATRAALAEALQRRAAPSARPAAAGAATEWSRAPGDQRMAHVMSRLVAKYGYPVNSAAGIVGNLWEESGVIPNRIEGSKAATPMRAPNFSNVMTDFTPEQVMNRNASAKQGPRLPGIGLAQWTSPNRRSGLFKHRFDERAPGAGILIDMDAQVDYLASELRSGYRAVDAVLRNPQTSLEAASDDVVYNFEVPGAILNPGGGGKRNRDDPAVQEVFRRRRAHSRKALEAYRAGHPERYVPEEEIEDWHPEHAEEELFEPEEAEPEFAADETEADDSLEDRELDPALLDIAERTIAREAPEFEDEASRRWTRCFSAADVGKVDQVYKDNAAAASADSGARCSCIVMLNVALGQLLSLPLKSNKARGGSSRTVQMAKLTTQTIEKAMATLVKDGYAQRPTLMNFFDRRNKTAGTLKPERLKASVQDKILKLADTEGCWFAFGLSILDGYHSVLLLVDRSGADSKIYWLDQFSADITDDVTATLDQRITDKTQGWWQAVMDAKGKGYNTTIRIWPLRKRHTTS